MEDILLHLLAHNAETRGVDRQKLESGGLRSSLRAEELSSLAALLLKQVAGRDEASLCRELAELFSYRLMFLLLPEECLFGEPDRDKPLIAAHLTALGVEARDDLVRAVKFLVDNFRAKTRREQTKTSISDVYVRHPKLYGTIIERQGGRCAVCGTILIYGVNMQLDHVMPWHLGDDPSDGSNWQFLCDVCNRGKGMLPHYALSSLQANWIRPAPTHGLREDVRYAALRRDGMCSVSGRRPTETELTVIKKQPSGCWILDNLRVVSRDIR
jgi:5-methylcytosine-specific restriction endonuclease McrA